MDWLKCRIAIYIDSQRFGAHHIISAARVDRETLREGMVEMFTLQRLKQPPPLCKRLATTNLIDCPEISGDHDLSVLVTNLRRKTETEISQEKVA